MNRLAHAVSAYLRSAAGQPIHWYPWGSEAFAAARAADRPILLDIGAVWCHWCHVMDGESYEDPALAEFLNARFVCIKVDRDERPDVDTRYQRAVQLLTRQGGWPLTAFLTPDGDVFHGGTYFPPEGRLGRPGFRTVLNGVLDAYHGRREQVSLHAAAIRRAVVDGPDAAEPGQVTPALLAEGEGQMLAAFDPARGGFGIEPKFPHPGAITFLLHRWDDQRAVAPREAVERTLQGMARGGIHDQLGGGFHRYSVDREWIVPHFEKMSYDNSELLRNYADAYTAFGAPEYLAAARGIVRWVRDVLADPDGGYGTSQDADVGLDDDGDYFTWTRAEAAAVLDPDALEIAADFYDIGTAGEMHHNPAKNVLYVATTTADIALRTGRAETAVRATLERADAALLAARNQRTPPFVDRSRYAGWNAMMAAAMLRAAAVLDDEPARAHALATLVRLRRESPEPDTVPHTAGGVAGLLDDQVHTAAAALDAWEATGESAWLDWSLAIMHRVWADYHDAEAGGLYDTTGSGDAEGLLPARARPVQDAPTPSANGTAGIVAARLHAHTGQIIWAERAAALTESFAGSLAELGLYGATCLIAADWVLNSPAHLVVTGPADSAVAAAMHARALRHFAARRVVQRVTGGSGGGQLPAAAAGMVAASGGAPRAFLCAGTACGAPAATLEEWERTLADFSATGAMG